MAHFLHIVEVSTLRFKRFRFWYEYEYTFRLGSDPLWYGSILFTWDRFKAGTVRFHPRRSTSTRTNLGYFYTGSDMFRFVWDRIRCGADPLCLYGTSSKLEWYSSIWDHLHKWAHLVPDSRSDLCRIHQVPCKHKAYPYQSRTGSKRMRSGVNTIFFNSTVQGNILIWSQILSQCFYKTILLGWNYLWSFSVA